MVRARRRRTFKREREDATEKVAPNVKIMIIVMIYVSYHHEKVTQFKYLDIYNNAFIIKLMVSIS